MANQDTGAGANGGARQPCLGTALIDGAEVAVLVDPTRGALRVDSIAPEAPKTVVEIIEQGLWDGLTAPFHAEAARGAYIPLDGLRFVAPYRTPQKIWGIGLNYLEHASDLSEKLPDEPASFIKANHTIIGPDEPIPLPWQSDRVTAEAELGLVIGKLARNVPEEDALSFVAGVVPILDQTAEDILQRNPRFLTRSKNFPGFFSFGPWITPLGGLDTKPDLSDISVATIVNGVVHRENVVANMSYSPSFLVSFHSDVMPLYPGDIISTGTPGAVVISDGDVATCAIVGLPTLSNPVRAK
jgi:2-keto-4-pentenoate hydratase/2-oxohepta-3-ene-1,7-dioic acid hydratase in catechol pathway